MLLSSGTEAFAARFHLEEATIDSVHQAFLAKELTATQLVELYLKRIAAYNGRCADGAIDPATGYQLGEITPRPNAGQVNALTTLNLRGKRSKTAKTDNDPSMPDALETARALDAQLARSGKLVGPLHGIPFAIKDEFDTRDMRSTSGGAANFAEDRAPDAEVVARLRRAGAIILAKANMGEYASGDRSTDGGTICNPYDTTRSAGRSSGGSGAAVAANLVLCALGEETGPSTRGPAANNNLVGIVATYSLVSHRGMMPAVPTRDRPGILCRTVKDSAKVLSVIAGYDPNDPETAPSVGQMPQQPYESFAEKPSLQAVRIGVLREFMEPFTKADEDSIRITEQAVADLKRLGAIVVDPGPGGQLFRQALAELVPALYSPALVSAFKELFSGGNPIEKLVEISLKKDAWPKEAHLRWFMSAAAGGGSGGGQYVMNRYLAERGDSRIRDLRSLIDNSVFFTAPSIEGITPPPNVRLESQLVRREILRRKDNGTPFTREVPITELDIRDSMAHRDVLQALVLKVMADHQLDALVYPTKTIPAPVLFAPLEPQVIKAVTETSTVTIDGVEYLRTSRRVLDERDPKIWGLSPSTGFPAIAVPAGFTKEVYDRAVIVGEDGSKRAGDLLPPKALALPVSIDFFGRPFSEPTLLRIAAAYEAGTKHRRPPKDFGPLAGE